MATLPALGADVWLQAGTTTIGLPDPSGTGPVSVAVWGYASCTDGTFATCGPVTVPGPALNVAAGDTAGLTVHLKNTLTVPTSLVINGLVKPMAPVWDDESTGARTSLTQRVRSFDTEAAAGGGVADFVWANVPPGTYLYQSGTQPQVQVQMGLYGALTRNAVEADLLAPTPAQAYAGVPYDNQTTLLYSEIDPDLHAAVATGAYGTTGPTSTFDYNPKYFLINGGAYQRGTTPAIQPVGSAGTTLLRLLNAGLTTHVPSIQDRYWDLVAEDGKPYSFKRSQYAALLPAAKTMDVLLTPDIGGGSYAVIDRRLNLSNAGQADGGMLAFLAYGAAGISGSPPPGDLNTAPVANPDSYDGLAGVELSFGAPQGVLANDTDAQGDAIKAVAASGPTTAGGSYVLNTNGSFTYTPPAAIPANPADTFTYLVTDGKLLSGPATVTINLAVPVAPTLGTPLDNFNRADSTAGLGSAWAQTASSGSGPDLQLHGNQALAATVALGGQAIWVVNLASAVLSASSIMGNNQFAGFRASGSLLNAALILKASGGTPKEPANFVRVRYEAADSGDEIVVATRIGGSDVGAYVKQAAFPALASSGTLSASVDAKGLVSVFQGESFVGGVQLPDVGAWKGKGRIGIQLQSMGATIDDFSGGTLP